MASVVIASLVLDVTCSSEEDLARCLDNLATRLRSSSSSLLLLQGSLDEHTYAVGSASLPALEVDEETLRRVVRRCGFSIRLWRLSRAQQTTHYFAALQKETCDT